MSDYDEDELIVPDTNAPVDDEAEPADANADHDGPDGPDDEAHP